VSRNGKAQVKIVSEKPLIVFISKNGRATSEESAYACLKRAYPEKPREAWIIHRTDHSLRATLR
jgi:hypothetical protein